MSAAAGGAAAAIAAADIANAVKASGAIVQVSPEDFHTLLQRAEGALVVHAEGGVISTNYQYLMSYKGLAFFTKASRPLTLPVHVETIRAGKIWIPG